MRCHGIRGKPSFIFNLTNPRIDWAISLCCMACPRRYGRYKLRNDRFMFHAQKDFWYGSKIVSWRSNRIAGVASLMGCHQDHYINRNKNRIRSHLRIQEQWTRTVASRTVNLEKIDGTVVVWNRVFSAISTKSYQTNTEKKLYSDSIQAYMFDKWTSIVRHVYQQKRGIRLFVVIRSPRTSSVDRLFVFNLHRQIRMTQKFCLRRYGTTGWTVSSIPRTDKASMILLRNTRTEQERSSKR